MLSRPTSNDIGDFQAVYIANCPDDIIPFLVNQAKQFNEFVTALDESQLRFRYAPGKWSLREVIIHIIDTELIFDYRCLAILRGDTQVLNGFDQDIYIDGKDFSHYSADLLAKSFENIRNYSLLLYEGFTESDWLKRGNLNNYVMGLNAMPYMIGGHLEHHMKIINERYIVT